MTQAGACAIGKQAGDSEQVPGGKNQLTSCQVQSLGSVPVTPS